MALGFATTLRTARASQIVAAIDAGAGAGKLRLYNGTRPATGGTVTTLLAELTFSDPCGTVTNGVLTFNNITSDASADNTGTATWFRIVDSTGAFVLDGTITVTGGGGDITMTSTSIQAGVTVDATSLVFTGSVVD